MVAPMAGAIDSTPNQRSILTPGHVRTPLYGRGIGMVLMMHYVLVCAIKIHQDKSEDIWWLCHATLALAAAGLFLRARTLIAMAFIGVLVPHVLWLSDALLGSFPGLGCAGVHDYLVQADALTWLSTCHHFYLIPLLWISLRCMPEKAALKPIHALFGMAGLFVVMSVVSRVVLPEAANINFAHALFPASRKPLLVAINALPAAVYLLVLNSLVIGLLFVPAWLVLGWLAKGSVDDRADQPSPSPSASSSLSAGDGCLGAGAPAAP